MHDAEDTMESLIGALPYLKRYDDQIIVVKYGGHAMGEEETALRFGRDIALLEQVGHQPGGGAWRRAADQRDARPPRREVHLRAGPARHDQQMVEVVEMVLAGTVNKQVAESITRAGALAVGISGKDGNLIRARKATR
jgi:acetylglutamate kinase